jgi:type II secretory ATPase GspE/PulE/Tfp pilus assembly ATPase PilB-like protein
MKKTFKEIIQESLRRQPDVIIIGEIRYDRVNEKIKEIKKQQTKLKINKF